MSSPVRAGAFAARHELREGDRARNTNGSRSELKWGSSRALTLHRGSDVYIGWSTFFPADFPYTEPDVWGVFFQLHPPGPTPPPLHLAIRGHQIALHTRDDGDVWKAPLVRGRWLDFVARVRSGHGDDEGQIELWYDGAKVVSDLRTSTLHPGLPGTYVKLGLYRDPDAEPTAVLYQDELRVGTSYEAVVPR